MNANQPIVIAEVPGQLQAELLYGLLAAQGIDAMLSEQSAARAIGLTSTSMASVQILVRADQAEAARQVIADYERGAFEDDSNPEDFDLMDSAALD